MMPLLRRIVVRVAVSALALALAWAAGYAWFAQQVPHSASADPAVTDAIVVLTGGSGRIPKGFSLLAEGKAERLFISGVETRTTPEAMVSRLPEETQRALRKPLQAGNIGLGFGARNTIGNALESSLWIHEHEVRSIRLVTANYHMPRALEEFHFELPDITIVPDPVIPDDVNVRDWWRPGQTSRLLLSEYHKFLASVMRHHLISYGEDA